jgi:hypothetical protein
MLASLSCTQGGGLIAGLNFSLYKGFRMVSREGPWPCWFFGSGGQGATRGKRMGQVPQPVYPKRNVPRLLNEGLLSEPTLGPSTCAIW